MAKKTLTYAYIVFLLLHFFNPFDTCLIQDAIVFFFPKSTLIEYVRLGHWVYYRFSVKTRKD